MVELIYNLGNRIGLLQDNEQLISAIYDTSTINPYLYIKEFPIHPALLVYSISLIASIEAIDTLIDNEGYSQRVLDLFEIANEYDDLIILPEYFDFKHNTIRAVINHELGHIHLGNGNKTFEMKEVIADSYNPFYKKYLHRLLKSFLVDFDDMLKYRIFALE